AHRSLLLSECFVLRRAGQLRRGRGLAAEGGGAGRGLGSAQLHPRLDARVVWADQRGRSQVAVVAPWAGEGRDEEANQRSLGGGREGEARRSSEEEPPGMRSAGAVMSPAPRREKGEMEAARTRLEEAVADAGAALDPHVALGESDRRAALDRPP